MSKQEPERNELVFNEQVKLRATLLNTIASGFVIVGIITPLTSAPSAGGMASTSVPLLMLIWFLLAVSLHCAATLTLESLQ